MFRISIDKISCVQTHPAQSGTVQTIKLISQMASTRKTRLISIVSQPIKIGVGIIRVVVVVVIVDIVVVVVVVVIIVDPET